MSNVESPIPVLVTSAGTASAVSVIKALKRQKALPVWILAVDADPTAVGLYLADEHAVVPRASERSYIPTLLELCARHRVKVLIPIYSKELEIVSLHAEKFDVAGVKTLLSKPEVIRRANDKPAMSEFVRSIGIKAPEFVSTEKWPGFPVVGKRNHSSGSKDFCLIESERDWVYWTGKHPDFLFQRFVKGTEYTVDILCNRDFECLVCSPRSRLLVKAGQSVKSRTVHQPEIENLSRKICREIQAVGPVNIQFIETDTGPQFIELNPRFAAGGLMLTVAAGANIPVMLIQLMLDERVAPIRCQENVLMMRYWEECFNNQP
jgi:carbamoyl-phosphate synthase large subunit